MSAASYLNLVTDVYGVTARPDRQIETARAIRKATMKFHLADLWKKDLVTVLYPLPVLDNTTEISWRYSVDTTDQTYFQYFRRLNSIDEYNNPLTGYELHFKELDQDRILDAYQLEDINYYYMAGSQAQLRVNKWLTELKVSFFRFPDVTPGNYTSWIADQFPDFIVEEAASLVFASIGKDAEAQRFASMFLGPDGVSGNLGQLRMSEI